MDWKDIGDGFTHLCVEESSNTEEAIKSFCSEIQNQVIPNNKDVEWDFLKIEVWEDSSRFIAFPAQTSNLYRIETAGCILEMHKFTTEYEKLVDSELEDATFSEEIESLVFEWSNLIAGSLKQSALKEVRVIFFNADDETPCLTIQL